MTDDSNRDDVLLASTEHRMNLSTEGDPDPKGLGRIAPIGSVVWVLL